MSYQWYKFIHIVGVAGFLLFHGASVSVALRLRKTTDRDKIRMLVEFSGSTLLMFWISFGLLLLGGILLATNQKSWGQTWLWESIGILVVTSTAMSFMARPYFRRVMEKASYRASGAPQASDEELAEVVASSMPLVLAAIGFAALLAILYLMIFKPT